MNRVQTAAKSGGLNHHSARRIPLTQDVSVLSQIKGQTSGTFKSGSRRSTRNIPYYQLAHGSHAVVIAGVNIKTNKRVAIKKLNVQEQISKSFDPTQAIPILVRLQEWPHANVVKFKGSHQDKFNVYQFFEYVSNDLLKLLIHSEQGYVGESQARHLLWDILGGLKHLHRHNIAHLNMKLENMLCGKDGKNVRVAGLGFASMDKTVIDAHGGAEHFAAPEVWRREADGYQEPYDPYLADLWNFGALAYTLLTGCFAFNTENSNGLGLLGTTEYLTLKSTGAYQFTYREKRILSKDAQDLLQKLLVIDPTQRLTLKQISCHPFFRPCALRVRFREYPEILGETDSTSSSTFSKEACAPDSTLAYSSEEEGTTRYQLRADSLSSNESEVPSTMSSIRDSLSFELGAGSAEHGAEAEAENTFLDGQAVD